MLHNPTPTMADEESSAAAAVVVEASEASNDAHVDEPSAVAAATPIEGPVAGEDGEDDEEEIEAPDPIEVECCPVCTMPYEYCEFSPTKKKCLQNLQADKPELFAELYGEVDVETMDEDRKSSRGGKAQPGKPTKKKGEENKGVIVSRSTRNKKKFVTTIEGLKKFGLDLKQVSKALRNRFAASSSVSDEDEIIVQGDVTPDIVQFLGKKFPGAVPPKEIHIVFKK
eukprot:m.112409 g.112409  ORF g.112409 m.112409 type:complete len:226 (-) comp15410_c0_seq1:3906-4583(-)